MQIGAPRNVVGGTTPIGSIARRAFSSLANFAQQPLSARLDAVFNAFIEEFRQRNWKYTAGGLGGINPPNLMGGVQTTQQIEQKFPGIGVALDCGRITELLRVTFDAVAISDAKAKLGFALARIDGHFVTKKLGTAPAGVSGAFACIDASVVGNVKRATSSYTTEKRCLFSDHYALKVNDVGKIYDACLSSTYTSIASIVDAHLERETGSQGLRGTTRSDLRFQALRGESPTGFSCGYLQVGG